MLQQKIAAKNNEDWQFILNYDLKREDNNEVQIGSGRFVHYFSPDKLPTLAKHIIFVIDVSGSMAGRKLKQTSDAMVGIMDLLNPDLDRYISGIKGLHNPPVNGVKLP